MNNAWEEYTSFWQQDRFIKLTAEELRPACPHLSDFNFELISGYRAVTLALPPIRVQGSIRVAILNRTEHEYQLRWISNTNRITSFAFGADAVAYAKQTWPEQLVEDNWVDVQHIQLCDPTHLGPLKSPIPIATLYVTLLQSWEGVEGNISRSLYQRWNNTIQHITTNPMEGGEYAGWQHKVHTRRNCSRCGGGLNTNACDGCGFSYEAIKSGWSVPLAPQLVEFLQSQSHSFDLHPSRLWE